jgi:hypothetical protein
MIRWIHLSSWCIKYIEVISPTLYWELGIKHSILQDWDKILSFENWKFKLYNKTYLKNRFIIKTIEIPKFSLWKYKGLKLKWYTCFEALEYIANLNGVMLPIKEKTTLLKTWIFLAIIIILLVILSLLWAYKIWSDDISYVKIIYYC